MLKECGNVPDMLLGDIKPRCMAISFEYEYICTASGCKLILWKPSTGQLDDLPVQNEPISCISFVGLPQFGKAVGKLLCLIIGFESGKIGILTIPNGKMLLLQQIHNQPVIRIKIRNYPSIPLAGDQIYEEEVLILFEDSTLVLIESESFMETIRAEYIKANNNQSSIKDESSLSFRKYRLKHSSSGAVSDVITFGRNSARESKRTTMIIAVGRNPMISVFMSDNNSLVTLATQVASKLTSSIFSYAKSWWGTPGDENAPEPTPSLPKSLKLVRTTQLEDPSRIILCIVQDGTGRLAAFGDAFGRVCLLDLTKSPPIIIRMWKGYREAQLAFMQISQPLTSPIKGGTKYKSNNYFSQYLVIYAPRRGLLEVWKVRTGSRQYVLNVGEDCILLNSNIPFGNDYSKPGIQNCYLYHKKSGELQKITVDPSLRGCSQQSQQELQKFILTLEKLESIAFETSEDIPSNEKIEKLRNTLLEFIPSMEGPDQFSLMAKKIISTALCNNENVFPLNFLVDFMELLVSCVNDKVKLPKSRNTSNSFYSIEPSSSSKIKQLHKIENIFKSISIHQKLYELYYPSTSYSIPCHADSLWKTYLDLSKIPYPKKDKIDVNIPPKPTISYVKYFEINSDRLSLQDENPGNIILFDYLFLPSKSNSCNLFIDFFNTINIDSFELQSIFAKWFFDISLEYLNYIPRWSNTNDEDEVKWSISLLIEILIGNENHNSTTEFDMDPLETLYHRCADSSNLYHVLVIIKIILDNYTNSKNSQIYRNYIQRWTILKQNISKLISFSEILPGSLFIEKYPLSIVSFETTSSILFYNAFIELSVEYPDLFLKLDFINVDLFVLKESQKELHSQFSKHIDLLEAPIIIKMHKIVILSSIWYENSDNCNITFLSLAIDIIEEIDDINYKRGILLKIWMEYLSPKASSLTSLVEKVRKSPKQSLLIRTVGMNTSFILQFLQLLLKCLDILLDISKLNNLESSSFYLPPKDDLSLWPPPFDSLYRQIHRIVGDNVCNENTIFNHFLLVKILQLIFQYDIRPIQPLQLFQTSCSFFTSFMENQTQTTEEELNNINLHRERFLVLLIVKDFSEAEKMADLMNINIQRIRIEAVSSLYEKLQDETAKSLMDIDNKDIFLPCLLKTLLERSQIFLQIPILQKQISKETIKWIQEGNNITNNPKDLKDEGISEMDEDTHKMIENQIEQIQELINTILSITKEEHSEMEEIRQICLEFSNKNTPPETENDDE